MVCNGPFSIKKWALNNIILKLERNLCYWDQKRTFLDKINISIIFKVICTEYFQDNLEFQNTIH